MGERLNSYVMINKAWLSRKILADYLRAKNMFANMYRESRSGKSVSFDKLKKLSDIIFVIKEDLHLMFKRIIDPKSLKFEHADKVTPNAHEIEFINNVGLLYHKTMVARELRYVREHYKDVNNEIAQAQTSMQEYLDKINSLFVYGTDLIKLLFRDYISNEALLYYVLDNDRYVKSALGISVAELLEKSRGRRGLDYYYLRIGQYCLESGWHDRARKFVNEALKINSKNKQAQALMSQLVN